MADAGVRLAAIYARVEEEAGRLHRLHRARLQCRRGCAECCVDGITVFAVEAESIRAHCADLLRAGSPHRGGKCAFLAADGSCRIYAQRPYVCRTQGLPLRWLEERDGAEVELRDICQLNEAGTPVEDLPAEACWTLGPIEASLAQLQADADGGHLRRLPLRRLFESPGGERGE